MDLMINPTITKFAQKVDGEITELKLGAKQEDAYAQIYAKGAESGGGKVENNKTATINVSTYTQPVEITPTSGKTSMKKATITLSNIPSPSPATSVTFYAWEFEEQGYASVYTLSANPSVGDYVFPVGYSTGEIDVTPSESDVITEIGEGTIKVTNYTYSRYATGDIVVTKAPV